MLMTRSLRKVNQIASPFFNSRKSPNYLFTLNTYLSNESSAKFFGLKIEPLMNTVTSISESPAAKGLGALLCGGLSIYFGFELNSLENRRKLDFELLNGIQRDINKQWEITNTLLDNLQIVQASPLLQLYSNISKEELTLLEEEIKKINLQIGSTQRIAQNIASIIERNQRDYTGLLTRKFMSSVMSFSEGLSYDLHLQTQQLTIAQYLSNTWLERKKKNFSMALSYINQAIQQLEKYREKTSQYPYPETIKSPKKMLVAAYNHKGKIHRSLAGIALDGLDEQELILSKESYEKALALEENITVRSSLGFLLNDMSSLCTNHKERKNMLEQALQYHRQAKSMDSHDPNIRHGLGYDLYQLEKCQHDFGFDVDNNNLHKALAELSRVRPTNARLFHDKGLVYLLLKDQKNALESFTEGLKLDSKHSLLLLERGKLLKEQGEYSLSLEDLRDGLVLSTDHPTMNAKYDALIKEVEDNYKKKLSQSFNQSPTNSAIIPDLQNFPALISKDVYTELDIRQVAKREQFLKTVRACNELAVTLNQKNKKVRCFISYAWANKEHPDYEKQLRQEQWVEQFAKDLEASGFDVLLDRWFDRRGKDLHDFVEKIADEGTDFVLVIGTNAYLEKYKRRAQSKEQREPVVGIEGRMIDYMVGFSRQRSERVIPIVLEGPDEASLPAFLLPKLTANFVLNDYFEELINLVRDLYRIPHRDANYGKLKTEFSEIMKRINLQEVPELAKKYAEAIQERKVEEKNRLNAQVQGLYQGIFSKMEARENSKNVTKNDGLTVK